MLNQNQFDYFLETYLQNTSFWDSKVLEDTVTETKVRKIILQMKEIKEH